MKKGNKIKEIILTILGAMIMAIGVSLFLLPNQLSTGGFSGIATITYYLFQIPVGTVILIANIPVFIVALRRLGKTFFLKSILGTISLSVFIDIFDKIQPITNDRFLASIYGGIIVGIGTALILKSHSSTGGSDLVSNIIKSYKPNAKIGSLIVYIDTIIVGLNVIVFKNIEIGLYSAIAIYLMGKIVDIIFEGIDFTKLVIIISKDSEEISRNIEERVERGVTGLYGKGMYTNEESIVLMCATARKDIGKIKEIAKSIDDKCFIIITNAREVFGNGFK
ncbi:MAG: YitT family protein [Clostridia bacterium]|nr:YitT family protein [Clostridia bacterium]